MASLPFSATCSHHSTFIDFNYTAKNSKVFFLRNSRFASSRRNFFVKSVASDQNQDLKEAQVTEEGSLDTFVPDSASIASSIKYHAEFTPSFSPDHFELPKAFYATAETVRDSLIINWNATYEYYEKINVKQAYYLSMEFLQGRALLNAIGNLELTGAYAEALKKLGHNLEDVAREEPDAALGNGGLGRLASCFLDSLATLNYPAWGYGLRYKYGLFKQHITKDGQEEVAENWLEMGNPWEIVRNDVYYPVKLYGEVISGPEGIKQWVGGENVMAVAYDVPIPGYKTKTTINLRLWSPKVAPDKFDLRAFNAGGHAKAYAAMKNAEKICYILYPGDESLEGKTLRLKQQYTLCSASLQDIIARYEKRSGESKNWENFPDKVAVQMNDTHPTLCIPELIRILMDVKSLSWEQVWNITQRTVAYTNHTVLPEALEKWSLELMQKLLPRHVEIIRMIDEELTQTIIDEYGSEDLELLQEKLKQMRILENIELPRSVAELFVKSEKSSVVDSTEEDDISNEETKPMEEEDQLEEQDIENKDEVTPIEPDPKLPKMVRMANLCIAGGYAVNGVAEIHSEIVKNEVFNEFYKLWPEKFQNKTNGVTPRRWIRFCNPDLSKIITKWTGSEDWVVNTEKLMILRKLADNEDLQSEWREAKRRNKVKVASFLREKTGYIVNPKAMFDVQVKRIHEYKRQLLNIMGIVYRYKKMKEMSHEERKTCFVPRVCIFGGKAFATYIQAKRIVKFITDVGATVNHDPELGDLLKVVFVPDYNVSVAEMLIPGSELSQHISTAGMEASGTSNMKFAMNGCILIGTLDGSNVEIRQEVGEDNFFLFGAQAHEIAGLRKERAEGKFVPDPRFEEVKAFVRSDVFGPYNYEELMGSLEGNEGYGRADYFLVGKDFPSYIECQEKVDEAYRDQKRWTKMSILNTAGSYKFSSDRTIHDYARDIWRIDPVVLP
ncbi:alpha-1,4 glucan phosphorylase L-2 isozyme, chloroplastic/amyloplastic-like isoform X1 [Herrania umbratica]|uniref:Alpha-1,4 glucan phosphorylase n=1 Tax=Herrania umbratica TaxID=108875 RepID=A0A6J1BJU4_9ROSI|nr:alpha-1,4 glucan phosphorylase L-2 isozyme, chloroplastic/amyloplastic-like isoform X1 [Herrania umbratica]XP_021299841.1 alpha-1,4 glucan phosphorylase L-2 isozyme, chloroplastic/amyloplastic-like isoform X1 [Herrania umbratica]XP_021299842.1 alpha-1,4 glucan phosphorylase L-2 isozyme, chloroplastic/amyloplastic-like isoform X1 [Herrania umbratica]